MRSTTTLSLSRFTLKTLPTRPLSLPAITSTLSLTRMLVVPWRILSSISRIKIKNYKTSGASEIIFMNPKDRSSRAIGPKIRVPIGSPLLAKSTAAFSSNFTVVSSGRPIALTVRTTTAFKTSPFLTFAWGIASLTVTTIISPIRAYRFLVPPNTLIQSTFLAPELSATFKTVSVWIMTSPDYLLNSYR